MYVFILFYLRKNSNIFVLKIYTTLVNQRRYAKLKGA